MCARPFFPAPVRRICRYFRVPCVAERPSRGILAPTIVYLLFRSLARRVRLCAFAPGEHRLSRLALPAAAGRRDGFALDDKSDGIIIAGWNASHWNGEDGCPPFHAVYPSVAVEACARATLLAKVAQEAEREAGARSVAALRAALQWAERACANAYVASPPEPPEPTSPPAAQNGVGGTSADASLYAALVCIRKWGDILTVQREAVAAAAAAGASLEEARLAAQDTCDSLEREAAAFPPLVPPPAPSADFLDMLQRESALLHRTPPPRPRSEEPAEDVADAER